MRTIDLVMVLLLGASSVYAAQKEKHPLSQSRGPLPGLATFQTGPGRLKVQIRRIRSLESERSRLMTALIRSGSRPDQVRALADKAKYPARSGQNFGSFDEHIQALIDRARATIERFSSEQVEERVALDGLLEELDHAQHGL